MYPQWQIYAISNTVRANFESGAALATVVGVLIEVTVMLSVVRIVNNSQAWYEGESHV
jgi:ACR3 family arsenite efflux pump ArsB